MKITSIKIEKLFDIFDYNISFNGDPNLLILTGPNGFGKTMILNIIYSLFNKDFLVFHQLTFSSIQLRLSEQIEILINKKNENGLSKIRVFFYRNEIKVGQLDSEIGENQISDYSEKYQNGYQESNHNPYINPYLINNETESGIISDSSNRKIPVVKYNKAPAISVGEADIMLIAIRVHFIREQRLFKKFAIKGWIISGSGNEQMIETIQFYSDELKNSFDEILNRSYKVAQELDSTYPNRLINEKGRLDEKEYNVRFEELKGKLEKLKYIGLFKSKQDDLSYSKDDAKALLVYINDLEKKLSVFDNLLQKLDLFTTILNERRFTYKKIFINIDKGFYFKTDNGKELELNQLSSGEQHEVVLLYELIFNAKENTLVLIDEPELSLHVTWQKEFIADLLKIIELQNIQVIVATHSPSIVYDRWDLVYTLEKAEVA